MRKGLAGQPLPSTDERPLSASRLETWASARRPYLDNLKVVLIAAIIALHGVLGYVGSVQLWSYADVQEVTLSPVTEAALFVVAGPFAAFAFRASASLGSPSGRRYMNPV